MGKPEGWGHQAICLSHISVTELVYLNFFPLKFQLDRDDDTPVGVQEEDDWLKKVLS